MMTYKTTDTALAAWLQIKGIPLIKIDNNGFPYSFEFDDSDSEVDRLVTSFRIGLAEGNIFNFFRAYKNLISQIKDK